MKNYKEFLNDNNPRVELEIEGFGKILLELFEETAPITVNNFLSLVDKKFYDGLTFHRIIKGFMIQGGDPMGNGMGGSDKEIKGEFRSNGVKNDLAHEKGVISMARAQNPNSASSQFFIMHDNAPYLDGSYAAFGATIEGFDVIDKVASVDTDMYDAPKKKVTIKSIKRVR